MRHPDGGPRSGVPARPAARGSIRQVLQSEREGAVKEEGPRAMCALLGCGRGADVLTARGLRLCAEHCADVLETFARGRLLGGEWVGMPGTGRPQPPTVVSRRQAA